MQFISKPRGETAKHGSGRRIFLVTFRYLKPGQSTRRPGRPL